MNYIIPAVIFAAVIYALKKRSGVYSSFTQGSAEGLEIIINIFPAVIAVMSAAYMLRASGAMDAAANLLKPVTDALGLPAEIIPLIIIRPLSGSGAMGLLSDILNACGADSETGLLASVIAGSTETTFYCLCVYFSQTRVKHSAKVIPCALIGDAVSICAGMAMVHKFLM